jgi:hypothetical protein
LIKQPTRRLCELLTGQRNVATTGVVSPVSMPCRSLVLTMIAFPNFLLHLLLVCFYGACAMSTENLAKVLKLVDLALTRSVMKEDTREGRKWNQL